MKFGIARIGMAAGILSLGVAGLAMHSSGASAATVFPLSPSGVTATGRGAVTLDNFGSSIQVRVDIDGARPGSSYRLAACMNVGAYQCSYADGITTPGGSFHGSFFVAPQPRVDLVTLTNVQDYTDTYQSVTSMTAGYPVTYTNPNPSGYILAGQNGVASTVLAPAGASVRGNYVNYACPAGYRGTLSVVVGANGYVYPYWAYGNVYNPAVWPWTATRPYGLTTTTIAC